MVTANTSEWLQPPTSFSSFVSSIMSFWPYLTFSTNYNSKCYNCLPTLTHRFVQVTCTPGVWKISYSFQKDVGPHKRKFYPLRFCSTTHFFSLVHTALTLQFLSCLRIPRHRISSCLVGTPPKKSFANLELAFLCALPLVFQHLLLGIWRPNSLSHLWSPKEHGLADTITFLQMQLWGLAELGSYYLLFSLLVGDLCDAL